MIVSLQNVLQKLLEFADNGKPENVNIYQTMLQTF